MTRNLRLIFATASLAFSAIAMADLTVPTLSSNTGATYTLYLDFAGFDFSNVVGADGTTGTWGYTGASPGMVQAYDTDGDVLNFSSTEIDSIRQTWASVAQDYVGFDINVTTIDPFANVSNYATRQALYDATSRMMHTSIGGNGSWIGTPGGISYQNVAQYGNNFSGSHTNWVFGNGTGNYAPYMATAGSHEDGHGLGLGHQHDEGNGSEYSDGDYDGTNWGASGTYGPTMGVAYYTQRGTWRQGDPNKGNVNDVAEIQRNDGIGDLRDDGIGHSRETATALAVASDGTVNLTSDNRKGFILPTKASGYAADQYTEDFFAFGANGGIVTLTANDGTDWLQAGVADPGVTMRSVLTIYDFSGNVVGTGIESADTLSHTFSGILSAGTYYARIGSYGAYISAQEPNARYFNMGGYFLTGSGLVQAVPEPTTVAALGLGALATIRRRRK